MNENKKSQGFLKAVLIEDLPDIDVPPSSIRQSTASNINYSSPHSMTDLIRDKISNLYNNFVMTKVGQYETHGIYKALVNSLTSNSSKFIVAIVPNDNVPIGREKLLSSLKWVSFQTRTTTNILREFGNIELRPQSYYITSDNNISDVVNLVDEKHSNFLYIPDNLPLKIEVLKLKNDDSFANKGTVMSALELYQTVLSITN